MDIPITALWGIASGLLGAGVAWGALMSRTNHNVKRLEEAEARHQEDVDSLSGRLEGLAKMHAAHRQETTDRLARIETKLDQLIDKTK